MLAEAVLAELPDGSRDLAHELAEELAEELAVEHAISETLGKGGAPAASESLELERASEESSSALPGLSVPPGAARLPEIPALPPLPGLPEPEEPEDEDVPSGGPELSFFLPPDEVDAGTRGAPPAPGSGDPAQEPPGRDWEPPPNSGAERIDEPEVDASSSSTPLPWLRAPSPGEEPEGAAPTRALDEASSPDVEAAMPYDTPAKQRDTPARSLAESSAEDAATMIGANLLVAEALERVARRIRSGELRVPAVGESAGEASALASALAVLLGVRS